MAKPFGVRKVSLDGVDWGTKPGGSFSPGGVRKTSQYASGRRTGASEEPMGCRCEVTFELVADTDVQALRDFQGKLTVETDNGIVFEAPNCETMEPPEISDQGGGIRLIIEGDEAVQL